MKSSKRATVSLSAAAVGLALALSPVHAALAQDSSQGVAQEPAQKMDQTANFAAAKPANGVRVTRTGSHIARVRNDDSLPVSEYDRARIDQSGAATTADFLRTIPQIQISR